MDDEYQRRTLQTITWYLLEYGCHVVRRRRRRRVVWRTRLRSMPLTMLTMKKE